MDWSVVFLFLVGLVALAGGSELLVRGASRLATRLGISPLVIGLTVVAFGTGAPELAVSTYASWGGKDDLLVGNIVGSNIANIMLVLGFAAVMAPVVVARQVLRFDLPVMVGASVLLIILALDSVLGFFDGIILALGILVYTGYLFFNKRNETDAKGTSSASLPTSWQVTLLHVGQVVVGLILLALGAQWLIGSATTVAGHFHISEWIIGLTVVAIGTSLPELAITVVACLRGERDMAVGNAVGSCTFNILAVLGVSALVAPGGIKIAKAALQLDLPLMLAVVLISLPLLLTGRKLVRWEGSLLLGGYIAYAAFLLFYTATVHT